MSTSGSSVGLQQSYRNLSTAWQQARVHWRDVKAQEFEHRFLEPLPHALAQAALVMEDLNKLLTKVKDDCG